MSQLITSLRLFLALTFLTGAVYPLLTTGLSQTVFPSQANGSLIFKDGQVIASELIGQKFTSDHYFHSRPSAIDYNPSPSGGTNLGPISRKLKEASELSRKALGAGAPQDLVFASASGVDPHISLTAAKFQIERIALARSLSSDKREKLNELLLRSTEKPDLGFLGEERVNVVVLNLGLDAI